MSAAAGTHRAADTPGGARTRAGQAASPRAATSRRARAARRARRARAWPGAACSSPRRSGLLAHGLVALARGRPHAPTRPSARCSRCRVAGGPLAGRSSWCPRRSRRRHANWSQSRFALHADRDHARTGSRLDPRAGLQAPASRRGAGRARQGDRSSSLAVGAVAYVDRCAPALAACCRSPGAGRRRAHRAGPRAGPTSGSGSALALLVVAGLDYGYQRWRTSESLRMSREEVKRGDEGRPRATRSIRARLRAAPPPLAAQRRMMQDVRKADVVITNPTHFAVALRYDAARCARRAWSPRARALLAQRIIERRPRSTACRSSRTRRWRGRSSRRCASASEIPRRPLPRGGRGARLRLRAASRTARR